MSDVLCIYYSFSGNTRRAMKEIADAVGAEIVAIDDGADRNGWRDKFISDVQKYLETGHVG